MTPTRPELGWVGWSVGFYSIWTRFARYHVAQKFQVRSQPEHRTSSEVCLPARVEPKHQFRASELTLVPRAGVVESEFKSRSVGLDLVSPAVALKTGDHSCFWV